MKKSTLKRRVIKLHECRGKGKCESYFCENGPEWPGHKCLGPGKCESVFCENGPEIIYE